MYSSLELLEVEYWKYEVIGSTFTHPGSLPVSWLGIFVFVSDPWPPPPIWCCNMSQLQRWWVSPTSPPPHSGWEGGGGRLVECHSTSRPAHAVSPLARKKQTGCVNRIEQVEIFTVHALWLWPSVIHLKIKTEVDWLLITIHRLHI